MEKRKRRDVKFKAKSIAYLKKECLKKGGKWIKKKNKCLSPKQIIQ